MWSSQIHKYKHFQPSHVFLNADVHIYHKKQRIYHFPGVAKEFAPSRGHVKGNCNICVADQIYFVKIVNHLSHFMIFY